MSCESIDGSSDRKVERAILLLKFSGFWYRNMLIWEETHVLVLIFQGR